MASGPTEWASYVPECDDIILGIMEANSFVIARQGALDSPVTVSYAIESNSEPATSFAPLPGTITVPAGLSSAIVAVTPLKFGQYSARVELALTIEAGAGYSVGVPGAATIEFVRQRDPGLPYPDCNPEFQLLDVAQNRRQTIAVGQTPVPLLTTDIYGLQVWIAEGELPPGVAVTEFTNAAVGTMVNEVAFTGSASAAGAYQATIDVCPFGIVFTCRQAMLVISVTTAPPPTTPVTGLEIGEGRLLAAGAGMLAVAMLILVARRRVDTTPVRANTGVDRTTILGH